MKDRKDYLLLCFSLFIFSCCAAQPLNQKKLFTHQDTLRGSITPERSWWDVTYYDIYVKPDYNQKTLSGSVLIQFTVLKPGKLMQIDLQQPMEIRSVTWNQQSLSFTRDGNVFFVRFPQELKTGKANSNK